MTIEKAGLVLASRRILVVEDEFFIADDLVDALQDLGAVVLGPMATISEALAVVEAGTDIDFALLNVELRGEIVFPVAQALRERAVPFIFATGYDRDALPPEFLDVLWLEKPFNPAKLMQALSSLENPSQLNPIPR